MSERMERILLLGLLPLLIALIGWFTIVGPHYSDYQDAAEARDQARTNENMYKQDYKVSGSEQAALLSAFPAAPDADATRRWISQLAQDSDGQLVDFKPTGQGNTFTARLMVPKIDAAHVLAQTLRGLTKDRLLPLARVSQDSARLVRVREVHLVSSQTGGSTLTVTLLIPTRS